MTIISSRGITFKIIGLFVFSQVIYSCQSSQGELTNFNVAGSVSLAKLMPRIAKLANQCWTANGKPLSRYRVSSELNSLSGQPRILLVPRSRPQGLPSLVVLGTASAGQTDLSVFGPLLSKSSNAQLIRKNVERWNAGKNDCA